MYVWHIALLLALWLISFHSYNANVKELQDTPGSEYFAFLSRKAHEGALNQAKIDVAEARMRGEIGEAEKKGRAKQEISKIDADTAVLETKRKAEKAKADSELMNRQTELDNSVRLAKISAQRQAEMRDAELQKQVESKRAETELERLRAVEVTKSKVARESSQEKADASFYTEQKAADAQLYKRKMEADATCTSLNLCFLSSFICADEVRLSPEQRGRRRFLPSEARGRRNYRDGQSIWRARRCSRWPSGFPAV